MTGSRTAGPGAPRISVVIPARDDAPALRVCLTALAAQSRAPAEVIVVDNGSSDGTAAVAAELGARVVREPVAGIPRAAAAGYDAATGDVVARLDADTVVGPDWVERIAEIMGADGAPVAVTGTGRFYGLPAAAARPATWAYLGAYYVLCHAALGHHALWGSNMAVRRSAWDEVRAAVHTDDPELHDDLDLAFVLGPHRRIVLDRTLRVRVSGRSVLGAAQWRRRMRRAWRTILLNWQGLPPWERWAVRLRPSG
ncbi:glycosyltransferase [Georgenia sp. EYE_87]|uniref:glycosyltransferase family 2 protein n=1 Tax=Georgenia sp. EYE_87 TaxID=2853448 RepID=UPI0020061183|nr:glycosyltransferase family 2 protein [Georgenia sp. EYE_87]MCK6212717.1 glycosyltransferase [Georgenia sp. EYE_87]